jgi:hypothetical protein
MEGVPMSSWRDSILKEFVPEISRLTLVADPDGLLTEEGVLAGIKERGFELIPYDDHVAFRFAYESKYRSKWDRGEKTDLVVVLRAEAADLSKLPYDLLQAGRQLSFNLGDIFPNLSYPIVEQLDRADLDALYNAHLEHAPGRLGDNATKDFILRHVFEIEPALIKKPSDLLRTLLRRHYRKQDLPGVFDGRLIEILEKAPELCDWPLRDIVPRREAFFAFLQERWPAYIDHLASSGEARESAEGYSLKYPGPLDIPFGHDDVRVYVDNLFLEGLLQPVTHPMTEALTDKWVRSGIITGRGDDGLKRLEALLDATRKSLPSAGARHREWLQFALKWGQTLATRHACAGEIEDELESAISDFETETEDAFRGWLVGRYASLHNLPSNKPAMVHHVPHYLARFAAESKVYKLALVVIDGLAIDQWCAVREELQSPDSALELRESAVFAWAPTLTSVSRQAIFSGNVPVYFPESIDTTGKEPTQWARFWVDRGFQQSSVAYSKGLGENSSLEKLNAIIDKPAVRLLGIVIDKVDKIMHGMELGAAGMHNQVRQWIREGFLPELLKLLQENGFAVVLTSDHGNIEASGCGIPSEGVLADTRGERVRVYGSESLRNSCLAEFPEAVPWPSVGLPENYLPVMAPEGKAFVTKGKRTVAHGGASLREIIVPFVTVGLPQA